MKFLSRAFTALNLLPSMAATAWANRPSWRHRAMNWRQAPRIAGPLSFLKSAMILKSGVRRPVSHMSSTLRWVSRYCGDAWRALAGVWRPRILAIRAALRKRDRPKDGTCLGQLLMRPPACARLPGCRIVRHHVHDPPRAAY